MQNYNEDPLQSKILEEDFLRRRIEQKREEMKEEGYDEDLEQTMPRANESSQFMPQAHSAQESSR